MSLRGRWIVVAGLIVGAAIGLGACRTKPTVVGTTQAQAPSPTVFAPVPAPTVPAPTTPSPAASASPGARLHDGHLELISFQHWANDYGLDVFGDAAPHPLYGFSCGNI
jgi:hypothetical protein